MTTTPGPRTEAGKRLWTQIQGGVTALFHDDPVIGEAILAIEAEARADVDGLVARIKALEDGMDEIRHHFLNDNIRPGTAAFRMVAVAERLAGDKAEAPE